MHHKIFRKKRFPIVKHEARDDLNFDTVIDPDLAYGKFSDEMMLRNETFQEEG